MNNYTDMTDGEINEAVHTDLGWACDRGDHGDERPVWSKDGTFMVSCPNYCNDDAAIGPIIWSNEISMEHESLNGSSWGDKAWRASGDANIDGDLMCFSAADKNPKRAAAICYLMMQGE